MTDHPDPAAALASIREAREGVHARVASKGWRHDLIYAAVVSVMVGAQGAPVPFSVLGSGIGALTLALLFQFEARRTGIRVLGTTPKRARWVAFGIGMVMVAAMLPLVALQHRHMTGALLVAVPAVMVVAFVLALLGSRLWRKVYRAELWDAA